MTDEPGQPHDPLDGWQPPPPPSPPPPPATADPVPGEVGLPSPPPPPAPKPPRSKERRPDPWAHRRGEPRVFAFLWTLFLFVATAATFLAALSTGQSSPDVMRPATRALFAIVAAGIVILWPMVRLSQLPDRHPLSGCLQDLVVILVPVQAVIWPQWFGWLGRWPLNVVTAIAALLAAWALLSGGLLALAQTQRLRHLAPGRRAHPETLWMILMVAVALGGALPTLLASASPPPRPADVRLAWMLSPMTAIFEITRDRSASGASADVAPGHWWAIACVAAAALPAWILALIRRRGIKPPSGLH